MKKIIILFVVVLACLFANAQNIGIGKAPDPSAALHITTTSQGFLIPRMTPSSVNLINSPAKGLMVYDSVNNQLKINTGSPTSINWKPLALTNNWGLKGNSGTNPALNFIGTTDNHTLYFRVNNIPAGFIDSSSNNTLYGFRAGSNTSVDGFGNTGFGYYSSYGFINGIYNTSFGGSALLNPTNSTSTEGYNTAIGAASMGGDFNGGSAVGFNALGGQRGSGDAVGAYALASTRNGIVAAFGHMAMGANSAQGLAIGSHAFFNAVNGTAIAIGFSALYKESGQTNIIAIGDSALYYSYQKKENIAIGSGAALNIDGNYNVATGAEAMYIGFNDSLSVATGYHAGFNGGFHNTSAGYLTIASGSQYSTADNTVVGAQALYSNTFGNRNTALGAEAMYKNGGGYDNVAIGFQALRSNSEGRYNVAIGANALFDERFQDNSLFGNQNTAVGNNALLLTSVSLYNTAIGYNAASKYDQSQYNTIIGANCDIGANQLTNCVALGQDVTCTASNQVRIGNLATYSIGGFADWTIISDGRMKKDVQTLGNGLNFIMKLRPVTYTLDINSLDNHINKGAPKLTDAFNSRAIVLEQPTRHTGFVAQEVEAAALASGYDFSGVEKPANENSVYGLRYADFVSPVVKALQEQQQIIQTLKKQQADILQVNKEEDVLYQQLLTKIIALESKPVTSKN